MYGNSMTQFWPDFYQSSSLWPGTTEARAVLLSLLNKEQQQSYRERGQFTFEVRESLFRSVEVLCMYGQHWNIVFNSNSWCSLNRLGRWGPVELTMIPQVLTLRKSIDEFKRVSRCEAAGSSYFHTSTNTIKVTGHYYPLGGWKDESYLTVPSVNYGGSGGLFE